MLLRTFKAKTTVLLICLAIMAVTFAIPILAEADDTLVMNINREGTAGYAVGTTIAKTISKYSDLKISGIPYSSPVAGFRDAAEGKCAIPYGSGLDLWQAYNGKGPYAKHPLNNKVYQGFYNFDADLFWITRADRDDIKSLSDINGKKVFPGKMGSGISEGFKYMLKVLDIKMGKNVQMGYMDAANALKSGLVEVVGVYVVGRAKAVPSWTKNIDSQVKIKIIEPNEAEVKTLQAELKKYGIGFEQLAPPFKQNTGIKGKTTWMGVEWWGWHFSSLVKEADAYTYLKTLFSPEAQAVFKNGHKFLAGITDPKFVRVMEEKAIGAVAGVPVHPGVAKYLKEIKLWQPDWKVGK